jgi:ubiquinone biosynthesis protein UbiJ
VLDLDPLSAARLADLEGIRLRFDIMPPLGGDPRPLTLEVSDARLRWRAGPGRTPNVIIAGRLPAIARLLADPDATTDVTISGDETVLARVRDLTRHFEPDLGGPLGRVVGSELADELLGLAEAGIAFIRSAAETVSSASTATAREHYLDSSEFGALLDRLDALTLRADRLEARVSLLEGRRAG